MYFKYVFQILVFEILPSTGVDHCRGVINTHACVNGTVLETATRACVTTDDIWHIWSLNES